MIEPTAASTRWPLKIEDWPGGPHEPLPSQQTLIDLSDSQPISDEIMTTKTHKSKTARKATPQQRRRPSLDLAVDADSPSELAHWATPIQDVVIKRLCLAADEDQSLWKRLKKMKADDSTLRRELALAWTVIVVDDGHVGVGSCAGLHRGEPAVWFGLGAPQGEPSLMGPALVARVREVMGIPVGRVPSAERQEPEKAAEGEGLRVEGQEPVNERFARVKKEGKSRVKNSPANGATGALTSGPERAEGGGPRGKKKTLPGPTTPALNPQPSTISPTEHCTIDDAIVRVPLDQIDESPWQERGLLDSEWCAEIRDSMQRDGQLAAALVRIVGGRYRLIAGHTRKAAAVGLGWSELQVRIVECDDLTEQRLVLIENAKRRDLTEREKCRAYAKLMTTYEAAGKSQTQLAADLGIAQSTLSNTLRLQSLPESLWQRYEAHGLTIDQARALSTWCSYPLFVQHFEKHASDVGAATGPIENSTFERCLDYALDHASRPMKKDNYGGGCLFKPTDEQSKDLDVQEVKSRFSGSSQRAFNLTLWNKLNNEAKKKAKEKEKAKAKAQKAQEATAGQPGKAKVERTDKTHWGFERELKASWDVPRRLAIRDVIASGKLTKRQREVIARMWSVLAERDFTWESALATDWIDQAVASATASAKQLVVEGRIYWFGTAPPEAVLRLANEFNGDVDSIWKPTAALLSHCAEADLLDLAEEAELISPEKAKPKLIEQLITAWAPGWVPELFQPAKPKTKKVKR